MVSPADSAATAAADAAANASLPPPTNTSATSSGSSSSSSNGDASPTMSPQDQERLAKLGVVLVNVGAASEERVFGSAHSAAMAAYRDHRMSDLLVINRKEDDAAAHPFRWYKPWSWWSSGPQVSPILRVPAATSAKAAATTPAAAPQTAASATGDERLVTATQTEAVEAPPLPAAEAKAKPKKKKGLPAVDMRPLTDSEVAALTTAVQEDRTKMLAAEEKIHKALQNIEDTRYRYLVPARDLHCEAEVLAVVQCYATRHRAAAATVSSSPSSAATDGAPLVRSDLLACGPAVQQLKKCAESMAMAYNHEGEVA